MRVNHAMIEAMKAEGVEFIFGLWGGFVYGQLTDEPEIKGIQLRHEGSAPFAAMAYSRLSGKTGACAASGSGGTGLSNMVSGVLEAYSACTPMIIHTHAPSTNVNGMGAFAECDNVELMKPITKWSTRVPRPERMPWFMHRAFSIALNGKPGPVFLEVPSDIMNADVEMPRYQPITRLKPRGDPDRIREAVDLLVGAERPIIVAGGGTILSKSFESFKEFIELMGIPFFTTPQGRSILPENHPLALGLCGIYTSKVAKKIYDEADLIMTIGSRMEAFQSITFRYFPENAKFIQVDIDPLSIGLNWVPDVAILGDARLVLRDLINGVRDRVRKRRLEEMPRIREIIKAKKDYEALVEEELKAGTVPISPKLLAKELNRVFGKNTVLCNENGNNDIWTYIYPYYKVLNRWSTVPMGEETCFGLGIVGTIGAKLARPDMNVLCPTGDGAFQHYNKEIATAAQYRLGVTWAIFNNFGFGVPQQFKVQPDFVKLATASKCYGEKVERPSDLKPALKNALKANQEGTPAIVDVIIQHNPRWGAWESGFQTRTLPTL